MSGGERHPTLLLWTTAMLKLSRLKTSNDLSGVTEKKDKEKIISTMRAIEVFTFLSCMAMGILTTISLQFPILVWKKFSGWLRTRSSEIPSVETVRSVLQQELWRNTCNLSKYEILSSIHKYQKQIWTQHIRPVLSMFYSFTI